LPGASEMHLRASENGTQLASENYSVICSIPEEQNGWYWIIQCWKSWRILPKQRVVYIVYFYAILFYFVDYGIPLSQIKIVLFILANRKCLIRRRCCINILFIFAGQWKARVICSVLILENYPWCVLPLRSKYWKRDRLLE
jgi:hypothetical protein